MHTVVTQAVAASRNLEVLMYLRSLDCPWSETTYLAAAEQEGHLEILNWEESHDCPWDNSNLFPAAAKVPIETCINGYMIASARSRKNSHSIML